MWIFQEKDTILDTQDEVGDVKEQWLDTLKDLNVCSQKGSGGDVRRIHRSRLVYFMPHGGKYQMTETQAMVAKLPVLKWQHMRHCYHDELWI
ncbi:MAG: hypothetical protein ACLTS1_14385 [Coprococcus sp.]